MASQSERPDEQSQEASATPPAVDEYQPQFTRGALFPHEIPSKHWQADFSDSKQVYQGSALPIWILAGWAVFIIWALVYLYFGLSKY
jgi:hypothetical protein